MAQDLFVFQLKSDFLKALAHPARLRIIECLRKREASVGDLVRRLEMEQSGLSKHLAILKQVGILRSRQEKVTVFYSIRDGEVFKVLRPVTMILKRKMLESHKMLDQLGKH
jgi:ArsR family transcriptional regulator